VVKVGKEGEALKLKKILPTFSSFNAMPENTPMKY